MYELAGDHVTTACVNTVHVRVHVAAAAAREGWHGKGRYSAESGRGSDRIKSTIVNQTSTIGNQNCKIKNQTSTIGNQNCKIKY